MDDLVIRPARVADEPALGRYGGALMRQHHALDPQRFIRSEQPEQDRDAGHQLSRGHQQRSHRLHGQYGRHSARVALKSTLYVVTLILMLLGTLIILTFDPAKGHSAIVGGLVK